MKRIKDAFVFAREGRVLEGTLAVAGFERLRDMLSESNGEVTFRLEGLKGERGEAALHLEVWGVLQLSCQRCLKAVPFDLDIDSLLELVPEGVEMSQEELEDDTRDFLPVARELEVLDLVEDEILLALPVAPRHEKCGLPAASGTGELLNPFAVLSGLKGKPN